MKWHPAWRECLVVCVLALCVSIATAILPHRDDISIENWQSLLEDVPVIWDIERHNGERFRLHMADQQAVVRDNKGTTLGLMDVEAADELRSLFRDCKVMHRKPLSSVSNQQRKQWGLNQGVILHLGELHYTFGSGGTDRGYCIHNDQLLILSTDPATVLNRPSAAFRPSILPLPHFIKELKHDRGWKVFIGDDKRWWVQQKDGYQRWPHDQNLMLWLRSVANAAITGYETTPPPGPARAGLTISGSSQEGEPRVIFLEDLGPTQNGRERYVKRSQQLASGMVNEYYRIASDGLLCDPDPDAFISDLLIPLTPLRADTVQFGDLTFTRRDNTWLLQGSEDADQAQIRHLLTQLSTLKRLQPEPRPDGTQAITVHKGAMHYTVPYSDPRLANTLRNLKPYHYRHRLVLRGMSATEIVGVVFAPSDGPPEIYSRDPGQPWDDEIKDDITIFIQALLSATVAKWDGIYEAGTDTPFDVESTITIATAQTKRTIRLNNEGRICLPERSLVGTLNAQSLKNLSGE